MPYYTVTAEKCKTTQKDEMIIDLCLYCNAWLHEKSLQIKLKS